MKITGCCEEDGQWIMETERLVRRVTKFKEESGNKCLEQNGSCHGQWRYIVKVKPIALAEGLDVGDEKVKSMVIRISIYF